MKSLTKLNKYDLSKAVANYVLARSWLEDAKVEAEDRYVNEHINDMWMFGKLRKYKNRNECLLGLISGDMFGSTQGYLTIMGYVKQKEFFNKYGRIHYEDRMEELETIFMQSKDEIFLTADLLMAKDYWGKMNPDKWLKSGEKL